MKTTKLRISASKLLPRIREAAKSSSNVVFIPPLNKKSMAGMMTYRQALACLQSGVIVGKPMLDDHGHWEVWMERYAANLRFRTRVVAVCDGPRVAQLIVFPAEN